MTTEAQLTDLVAAVRSGDQEAEADFVRHFLRGVRIIARKHLHRSEDAPDLTQDVMMLLLEKIRGGEPRNPATLKSFVAAVARHSAWDWNRKRRRQRETALPASLEQVVTDSPDPLSDALATERARQVRDLLNDLPQSRDRRLLIGFYLLDIPKRELQTELGLTTKHFDRVLHRARCRFLARYLNWLEKPGSEEGSGQ